ncbi:MAG: hypothetical protein GY847_17065 [Proteobacteria bacterium]|nr:hypothetical protein [Pseudomonadota bacterium]
MYQFPKEPKKIRERIRRYERKLRKEQEELGALSDGYGKRYLLGPLYMLLGDTAGAINSFEWFKKTCPDDVGEPAQYLCWTLALYRSGNMEAASQKLRQTMLSNHYLIPHLLGLEQEDFDIWHGSNLAEKNYVQYVPPELFELWDEQALQWAKETYHSSKFCQVRERYIEIYEQLKNERPGPKRSQLVEQAFRLQNMD